MTDPHLWWYVTRASALVAWTLMTFSVLWGILLSTRVLRKIDSPRWLGDIHGYTSGLALIMVALHIVSLTLDGWLKFTLPEILIPFDSSYRNTPVALGIVAFYLLLAVWVTSLAMHRLPQRFWRGVHYASYGSLVLVAFHAGFTGTDVGTVWYRVLSLSLIGLATAAVLIRVIAGRRATGKSALAAEPVATTDDLATPEASPGQSHVQLVLRVSRRHSVADGVVRLRLVSPVNVSLPIWQPGAHITLHLPGGIERQYSLCGDTADRHGYEIAVRLADISAGGSTLVHAELHPGVNIPISGPFNHFELEPAVSYRFIAGGIGITPIRSMIDSLPDRRDWRLLYLGRSRRTMPFAAELEADFPGRVVIFAKDEHEAPVDLAGFVSGGDPLVYCCGPESLMKAVSDVVAHERIRLERFVPLERVPLVAARPVDVVCRKSHHEFVVAPGDSLLESMEKNGVPIVGSCRKGVCGTCEVRVVSGEVEHLDSVVDDELKDKLGVMYPCVSRGVSDELVLDI